MPMPANDPRFWGAGTNVGSYCRLVSFGVQPARTSAGAAARNAGRTEYVIDMGQPCPASTWLHK